MTRDPSQHVWLPSGSSGPAEVWFGVDRAGCSRRPPSLRVRRKTCAHQRTCDP
jgi:hypothetical protein